MSREKTNGETRPTAGARTLSVIANAASNYLRFFVVVVGMLLLTPVIISNIGRDDYGLWMLVMCVIGYFELLDCGFATATVKFIGQYQGAGDRERRNQLASTLLAVYSGIALLILALSFVFAIFFNQAFDLAESQHGKAIAVLLLLSAKVAVNLPLSLFLGVLFGQQRICIVNVVRVVAYLTYAAIVWFALRSGYGVVALAAINAVVFFLEHVAFLAICKWRTPDLELRPRLFDRKLFLQVASFSLFALITNVATVVLLRTDPIVVKLFLPLSAVAVYALALKISEQILQLTKQFVNVFTPLLAELSGAGNTQGVRSVFLCSSKFGLASLVMISIPLMFWSTEAMVLWVGPTFRACGPILALLVGAMHFKVLQEGASNVLGMTGRHRYVAATSIISALVNLALSLLLIYPFGLLGVAFATVIATAVVGMLVVVRATCDEYSVSWRDYASTVISPACLPAALQVVVCVGLRQLHQPASLIELAMHVAAASVTFAAAYAWFSVKDEEAEHLAERFPRLQSWLAKRKALQTPS